jgi:hypothetical protein
MVERLNLALFIRGGSQHNLASHGDLRGGTEGRCPLLQLLLIGLLDGQGRSRAWHESSYLLDILQVYFSDTTLGSRLAGRLGTVAVDEVVE